MVVELSLTFADLHEQIEMSFKESGFIVVMECPLWVIRDRAISCQCQTMSAMPSIATIPGMSPN
jgi:hypothetical protein